MSCKNQQLNIKIPPRSGQSQDLTNKKNALYLSVNVFSMKVVTGSTIFTSPTGDGATILHGHPSHAKVQPLAVQKEYPYFSVILRP